MDIHGSADYILYPWEKEMQPATEEDKDKGKP